MIAFIPLDGFIEGEGWRVSIVTEGEPGHQPTGQWPCPPGGVRPWFWGMDYQFAVKLAQDHNLDKLGITAEEAQAIVFSSMAAQSRHSNHEEFDATGMTYIGKQAITARLTEDGDLFLEGIGYYEDDLTVPAATLRALGYRRTP